MARTPRTPLRKRKATTIASYLSPSPRKRLFSQTRDEKENEKNIDDELFMESTENHSYDTQTMNPSSTNNDEVDEQTNNNFNNNNNNINNSYNYKNYNNDNYFSSLSQQNHQTSPHINLSQQNQNRVKSSPSTSFSAFNTNLDFDHEFSFDLNQPSSKDASAVGWGSVRSRIGSPFEDQNFAEKFSSLLSSPISRKRNSTEQNNNPNNHRNHSNHHQSNSDESLPLHESTEDGSVSMDHLSVFDIERKVELIRHVREYKPEHIDLIPRWVSVLDRKEDELVNTATYIQFRNDDRNIDNNNNNNNNNNTQQTETNNNQISDSSIRSQLSKLQKQWNHVQKAKGFIKKLASDLYLESIFFSNIDAAKRIKEVNQDIENKRQELVSEKDQFWANRDSYSLEESFRIFSRLYGPYDAHKSIKDLNFLRSQTSSIHNMTRSLKT